MVKAPMSRRDPRPGGARPRPRGRDPDAPGPGGGGAARRPGVADSEPAVGHRELPARGRGKRFRPMLVLLAGYFGDPADPRLIPGSVAIELTHVATLYHDDVIDEAECRHGVPSANARWDNTVAILTGRLPVRPRLGALRRPRPRRLPAPCADDRDPVRRPDPRGRRLPARSTRPRRPTWR